MSAWKLSISRRFGSQVRHLGLMLHCGCFPSHVASTHNTVWRHQSKKWTILRRSVTKMGKCIGKRYIIFRDLSVISIIYLKGNTGLILIPSIPRCWRPMTASCLHGLRPPVKRNSSTGKIKVNEFIWKSGVADTPHHKAVLSLLFLIYVLFSTLPSLIRRHATEVGSRLGLHKKNTSHNKRKRKE